MVAAELPNGAGGLGQVTDELAPGVEAQPPPVLAWPVVLADPDAPVPADHHAGNRGEEFGHGTIGADAGVVVPAPGHGRGSVAPLDVVLAPRPHIRAGDLAVGLEPPDDRAKVELVVEDPDGGFPAVCQRDGGPDGIDPGERLEEREEPEVRYLLDDSADPIGHPREGTDEVAFGIVDLDEQRVGVVEVLVNGPTDRS